MCSEFCFRSPQNRDHRDNEKDREKNDADEEEKTQEQLEEEEFMRKVMGFSHFDSTKVATIVVCNA